MMADAQTIGILAPWMEGPFLGNILIGVHELVSAQGFRTVMICTAIQSPLDRDLRPDHLIEIPPGWERIVGWVVIGDALNPAALERLAATGAPIVTTCRAGGDGKYPLVQANNESGTGEATAHLLDHGHTRIAFIGPMGMAEMRERYAGYCAALRERGIEPEPALLFDVEHCWIQDGEAAAERLIAAGMPCTAVVAGNDQIAMGLLPRLKAAGYRVPEDVAIVGFDDINEVQYLDPPLSSVSQKSYALGLGAGDLLLKALAGATITHGPHRVPTALMKRQSCGCGPIDPATLDWLAAAGGEHRWTELLEQRLLKRALYPAEPNPAIPPAQVWPGIHDLIAALEATIANRPLPDPTVIGRAWEHALALTTNLEVLHALITLLGSAGQAHPSVVENPPAVARIETFVERLRLSMTQSRLAIESYHTQRFAEASRSTSLIHAALLRNSQLSPRDMRWLEYTGLRWGCLGMWQPATAESEPATALHAPSSAALGAAQRPGAAADMVIVGAYSRDPIDTPALGQHSSWGRFLPTEVLVSGGSAQQSDMAFLMPFETTTGDGGIIVALETVDSRFLQRYSAIYEWMYILTIALDREGLLSSLARQQHELREAKGIAEEANELKSKFLANMSHELRTPLNSILNFGRFLEDPDISGQALSDQQQTFVQRIIANGDHLLGVINDILDLAKIEAGKMTLYPERVELHPMLQYVAESTQSLLDAKGLALTIEVAADLPAVWADKTRLRQVLFNVLSNAAKFTDQGGITVRARPQQQGFVQVAVQDTGIGIPADKQHLIFEEFRQVEDEELRARKGTGLGMPISKRFVELHGGRMWFESAPGEGTTFLFTIPVAA